MNCNHTCLSSISCQVWTYSTGTGCMIDGGNLTSPITTAVFNQNAPGALEVVAGQYVQRMCRGMLAQVEALNNEPLIHHVAKSIRSGGDHHVVSSTTPVPRLDDAAPRAPSPSNSVGQRIERMTDRDKAALGHDEAVVTSAIHRDEEGYWYGPPSWMILLPLFFCCAFCTAGTVVSVLKKRREKGSRQALLCPHDESGSETEESNDRPDNNHYTGMGNHLHTPKKNHGKGHGNNHQHHAQHHHPQEHMQEHNSPPKTPQSPQSPASPAAFLPAGAIAFPPPSASALPGSSPLSPASPQGAAAFAPMVPPAPFSPTRRQSLFHAQVSRGPGEHLGIDVEYATQGNAVIIASISETGSVAKYNRAHPECQIKPGDCLIEVNGARYNTQAMMQELRKHQPLSFSVVPGLLP